MTEEVKEQDDLLDVKELIRVVVLQNGEQLICCLKPMEVGEDDSRRVIGYYLHSPCTLFTDKTEDNKLNASMMPWIPASKERLVPVSLSTVVTVVEPLDAVRDMYITNILEPSLNEEAEEKALKPDELQTTNDGVPIYLPNKGDANSSNSNFVVD